MKASVDEIRARFDQDVERFSNLETGQSATMDAPLALELVAAAAAATNPGARRLLDVGCGAGNYTLKLLQSLPGMEVTLVDLSRPMLERAEQRLQESSAQGVRALQGDIRELELGECRFDVIVAAAVLHHLRDDEDWRTVFHKFYQALSPGGSLWVFDLVESNVAAVGRVIWDQYARYLESFQGPKYREHVFDYIEREDTPRSLIYQLDVLREVGFAGVEVLHKHACFAAFGAVKGDAPV